MKLRWRRDGDYRIVSGQYEDKRPVYSIFKVQQGRRYFANYHWPKDDWIHTDGRVHRLTELYDGADGEAAKKACSEHAEKLSGANHEAER